MLDFAVQTDVLGTYRILIADGYRYPSLLNHAVENINKPFQASFLRLLEAAQSAGQIEAGHADNTTAHLWTGMLTGWLVRQNLLGQVALDTKAERDAFFERAWTLFIRCVGAKLA